MSVRRLVLGGALVALGLLVGVGGVAWALRGLFAIDASVLADGAPHEVGTGSGEHVVWVDSSLVDPDCTVEAGGTPLVLHPVEGRLTRSYGSAGPWEARWWFDAPGDVVTVRCEGVSRSAREAVEVGPRIQPVGLAGRLLGTVGVALLLVLAGGVLALVTVVRGLADHSRPVTT